MFRGRENVLKIVKITVLGVVIVGLIALTFLANFSNPPNNQSVTMTNLQVSPDIPVRHEIYAFDNCRFFAPRTNGRWRSWERGLGPYHLSGKEGVSVSDRT